MATFYIEVNMYWANSQSYFIGPFATRAAAAAYAAQPGDNVWFSNSSCGGDIRDAWRVYPTPISKTEATQRGLRAQFELSTRTRLNAYDLSAAARETRET